MRPLLSLLCLALAGCSTTGGGGLFGWWTQRGERAAERAEAKARVVEADVLAIAQRNVEELMAALRHAPASRPVAVALEAGAQASANLATLKGPLTAARLAEIEARAQALVSEEAAIRAPAEAARAAERRDDAATIDQLVAARVEADTQRERANQLARDNASLAAEALRARWASYAGLAASLLLGAATLALRYNLGGLQTAAGEIVGRMRAKYGVKDEDVVAITGLLDAPTTPRQQRSIAAAAARAAQEFLAAEASTRRAPTL